jgi:hypothetical protein
MPGQTYEFKVWIDDTEDEFSETFNPMDELQRDALEGSIRESIEAEGWIVTRVQLTRVVVDLD